MGKDESAPYPLILIPLDGFIQANQRFGWPAPSCHEPRSYQALAAGGASAGGRRQEVRAGDPRQWLQHEAQH